MPDEFAKFVERETLSDVNTPIFQLQPPKLNAPKVCVIDSGIQEKHPLLKAAIDSIIQRLGFPEKPTKLLTMLGMADTEPG